jgi:hypothetical protein
MALATKINAMKRTAPIKQSAELPNIAVSINLPP